MGMRYEIVCIRAYGYMFKATEGADFAAKVTYHGFTPGEIYDPRQNVKQEWLVPLYNYWPN